MIKYPKKLLDNDTVGITAISLSANLEKIDMAEENLKKYGLNVIETKDVRNESKNFISASDKQRAEEFVKLYLDDNIKHIIAARGGEFAIDIIPYLHKYKDDIEKNNVVKYLQGYSDISLINYYLTTNYNIATLHAENISDFSMKKYHESLLNTIKLLKGDFINDEFIQDSFDKYQKEELEDSLEYNLTEKVKYKSIYKDNECSFSGRIIGGCIDVITLLIGTKYDNTINFCKQFDEGIIWYIDNFGLDSLELYRRLLQMKNAGFFFNTKGFLFGRTINNISNPDFTYEYALKKVLGDLNVNVVYDVDIGHVPPQFTIVNGSYAKFEYFDNKGRLTQILK